MRVFASIIILAIVAITMFFLNPWEIRERATASIIGSGFLPQSVKDHAEKILLTPKQRREILVQQLEENFRNLKNIIGRQNDEDLIKPGIDSEQSQGPLEKRINSKSPETHLPTDDPLEIIQKSEIILSKLKQNNEESTLIDTAATKIAEQIKGEVKGIITSSNSEQEEKCNCEN